MALRWQEGGELDLGQADWRPEFCNKTIPKTLLHTHWFLLSAVLPKKGVLQEEESSLLKLLHRTQDPQRTKS